MRLDHLLSKEHLTTLERCQSPLRSNESKGDAQGWNIDIGAKHSTFTYQYCWLASVERSWSAVNRRTRCWVLKARAIRSFGIHLCELPEHSGIAQAR